MNTTTEITTKAQLDKVIWSQTKAWFNTLSDEVQWGDIEEFQRVEAREMFLETCPTVESIRHHLTDDNGWDPIEVDDLLEHRCIFVNADGTTTASHDLWEYMAQQEPESN